MAKKPQKFFTEKAEMSKQERLLAQCFLIKKVDKLIESKRQEGKEGCYKNFLTVLDDSSAFLGRVRRDSKHELLLESITPAQLSALVPEIRIFKVVYDSINSKSYTQYEFNFDNAMNKYDVEAITQSNKNRSTGVGIKNVNWEFIGSNPAESKRLIKVNMKIFFASMQDMLKESQSGITFLDLIKPRSKSSPINDLSPVDHQVKMEVGWATPEKNHPLFKGQEELVDAISRSRYSMFLSIVKHDLNFEQDGRVTLDVQYWGRLESRMGGVGDSKFDILDVTCDKKDKLKQELKNRSNALNVSKKELKARIKLLNCINKKGKRDVFFKSGMELEKREIKKRRRENIEEEKNIISERKKRYENIMLCLLKNKKIHYIGVDQQSIGIYDGKVKTSLENIDSIKIGCKNTKGLERKAQETITNYINISSLVSNNKNKLSAKNLLDSRLPVYDSKCVIIHYFFFGDLMDVILDYFYKNEGEYFTRFLLGSVTNPNDNSKKIPLADIPISVQRFSVWFANAVIRKSKGIYPFNDFIRDIIGGLISPIMNEDCLENVLENPKSKQINSRIKPRISLFNLPGGGISGKSDLLIDGGNSAPKTYKERQRGTGISLHDFLSPSCVNYIKSKDVVTLRKKYKNSGKNPLFSYYYIHVTEELPYRKSNYRKDIEDGIYHFFIGTDKGLLKNVSFTQQNQPYYKEAIMKGTDLKWLKRLYNANIEMFGNATFIPGQKIYINPTSVGLGDPKQQTSIAGDMGLGGYYIVVKVTGEIESGKFNTTIECVWESKGDGTGIKSKFDNIDKCFQSYKKSVGGKNKGRYFYTDSSTEWIKSIRRKGYLSFVPKRLP